MTREATMGIWIRSRFDPGALAIYCVIAGLWGGLLTAGASSAFTIDRGFLILLMPVGLMLVLSLTVRQRGFRSAATAIEFVTLMSVMATGFVLLSFQLARLGMPFADLLFQRMDDSIAPGFDWASSVRMFAGSGWPLAVANVVYGSLWWQTILLAILLCATGRRERCWQFALVWAVSLSIALAIFALAPGTGPYVLHHLSHDAVPDIASDGGWRSPAMLHHLRNAGAVHIRPTDMVGIVQFPSFHTASACLFCWGLWPVRAARLMVIPWNIVLVFATIPIGGHYLIDIVSGVLLAIVGVATAQAAFVRRWSGIGDQADARQGATVAVAQL